MRVFLITTIHNQESRWEYIKSHLHSLDMIYFPILAPDYRLFLYGGLTEQQAKHQSLTMAYLQIAQTAIFQGIERYIVIEDDVSLNEGFEQNFLDLIRSLPEDWDFLYATKTEHNRQAGKTIPVNDYICKVIADWWETPITVWGRRMIESFNEKMTYKIGNKVDGELLLGHIDHELLKICEEGKLNFYGAEKNLANGLSTARHLANDKITFEGAIS